MASLHTAALAVLACTLASLPAHADFTISNKPTHDMSCVSGICTPTAPGANLNISELTSMLGSGDVTMKSGNGDQTTPSISIVDALTWTSTRRLTLEAKKNVLISARVAVAGTGALTIIYNEGHTGGDLLFVRRGKIDFWDLSSSLVINGDTYVLVNDVTALAQKVGSDPSGVYALARHYDASKDGTYSNSPISKSFSGKFEGLGHAIDGLSIGSSATCLGLFSTTESGAVARDLRLRGVRVTSTHKGAVGAAVGCNSGIIHGMTADGTVAGLLKSEVGGLVGHNDGLISNSSSATAVKAQYFSGVGGLAGVNAGQIADSSATGAVLATSSGGRGASIGGLAGRNSGSVLRSYATGSASGQQWGCIGGLIGNSYSSGSVSLSHATGSATAGIYARVGGLAGCGGVIDQSYATGNVQVHGIDCCYPSYVGGLVGDGGAISNSYSTGTVTGDHYTEYGGFLGSGGTVSTSYSIGLVTGNTDESYVGGFIGLSHGSLTNNVWDLDTSGKAVGCGSGTCSGVTGLTDAQLKAGLPEGFDPNIWGSDPNINNGYPYLRANPPL